MATKWIFFTMASLIMTYLIAHFKPKLRFLFFLDCWFISFFYFSWRINIIPVHHGWISFLLGCLLYISELTGLISFLIFQFLFTDSYQINEQSWDVFDKKLPSVDVLICTYNEPLRLLEMTIAAAVNLIYPKALLNIYVLDDGRRLTLKKLCEKYKVGYITRENNIGAKAGNINHALTMIHGELFAILDADMIVKPQFLQHTVGYFKNNNVAFVQTPQVYYNPDIYQYNLKLKIPNEQDYFMRDIQYHRSAKNAVLHVGTNAVFRRQYVCQIGNYPTCSITEDMAVGMILQSEGYDAVFINEELVYGLCATTLPELVKQRDRWCRGNIQVMRHYHPLFTKGLSWSQKAVYFDGVLFWFGSWQKMIFILCPLLYLIFDLTVLEGSMLSLICFYFPYFFSQLLMTLLLSPRHRSLIWGHYYEMVMAPYLSISIFKELFHVQNHFKVTEKNVILKHHLFHFHLVKRHIFLLLITVFAWLIASIKIHYHIIPPAAFAVNFSWSIYNALGLFTAVLVAWQKPLYRRSERIAIHDSNQVNIISKQCQCRAKIVDLSSQGIGLIFNDSCTFQYHEKITMIWDDIVYECRFVRQDDHFAAFQFTSLSAKQMCHLMKVFCSNLSAYYPISVKHTNK